MTLDELIKSLENKKHEIVVGFPKDKQVVYGPTEKLLPNGKTLKSKGGQSVNQVATWNEYGTKKKDGSWHSVPRPFLKMAERNNIDKIRKLVALSFRPANLVDPQRLDKIGIKLVAMVRDSIVNGDWAPNKPFTQFMKLKNNAKKAFGKTDEKSKKIVENQIRKMKPLIDTGTMKGAVNYEVREL